MLTLFRIFPQLLLAIPCNGTVAENSQKPKYLLGSILKRTYNVGPCPLIVMGHRNDTVLFLVIVNVHIQDENLNR